MTEIVDKPRLVRIAVSKGNKTLECLKIPSIAWNCCSGYYAAVESPGNIVEEMHRGDTDPKSGLSDKRGHVPYIGRIKGVNCRIARSDSTIRLRQRDLFPGGIWMEALIPFVDKSVERQARPPRGPDDQIWSFSS